MGWFLDNVNMTQLWSKKKVRELPVSRWVWLQPSFAWLCCSCSGSCEGERNVIILSDNTKYQFILIQRRKKRKKKAPGAEPGPDPKKATLAVKASLQQEEPWSRTRALLLMERWVEWKSITPLLQVQDMNLLFHQVPKVLYWMEIWWLYLDHWTRVNPLSCSRKQFELTCAFWNAALSCWKYPLAFPLMDTKQSRKDPHLLTKGKL